MVLQKILHNSFCKHPPHRVGKDIFKTTTIPSTFMPETVILRDTYEGNSDAFTARYKSITPINGIFIRNESMLRGSQILKTLINQ